MSSEIAVAYLIRAHHMPEHLSRLVRRLSTDGVAFFIHVSRSASDDVYAQMVETLRDVPRVFWTNRVAVRYGGFSLVSAALVAIEQILRSSLEPSHVVTLSGQDYPLRPAEEIVDFFRRSDGVSYLNYHAIPSDIWYGEDGGRDRIRFIYPEWASLRAKPLHIPLVRRRFPSGIIPYGGSAYWSLTLPCLAEIRRLAEKRPDLVAFLRYAKFPDELYFHTLVLNSPCRNDVQNAHLWYASWRSGGARPVTLTAAHLDELAASDKLFARKFDEHESASILARIDRELLGVPSD